MASCTNGKGSRNGTPRLRCTSIPYKLTEAHGVVGSLSNGKDVGRHLVPPLAAVQADRSHGVDGEPLVRVHGDTEQTGVGLNYGNY